MPTTQPLTVPSLKISVFSLNRITSLATLGMDSFAEATHVDYPLSPWRRRHRIWCSSGHRRLRVWFVSLWGIEGCDKCACGVF